MTFRPLLASLVCGLWMVSVGAVHAEDRELKYFVEVQVPSPDAAKELAAAGFDVAGVNRDTSSIGVVVTQDELTRLEELGWPVTIRSSNAPGHAVDALADYTDPQELSAFMDSVVAAHPDIAKKILLKDTLWEAQKQYALQITKDVNVPNERPAFMSSAVIVAYGGLASGSPCTVRPPPPSHSVRCD